MRKLWIGSLAGLIVIAIVAYFVSNYYPSVASLIRSPKRAVRAVKRDTTPLPKVIQKKKIKISLPLKNPVIKVDKSERTLFLYDGNILAKEYSVSLGYQPDGDKEKEGDGKTPEGEFFISQKAVNPDKKYLGTRWMRLSYPNRKHAERGLRSKLIKRAAFNEIIKQNSNFDTPLQNTPLGGGIGIHGGSDYVPGGAAIDWTAGCVGLYNEDAEEIYAQVKVGTKVYVYR